jgi:hypothetical protein
MQTNHRSRTTSLVLTALLAVVVSAPVAARAEEQVLAVAPDPGPSWDEASGYAAVESARAAASTLLSGERMSGEEQALVAAYAAAMVWDETSGYGAVEASRAENAQP